MSFSYFAVDVVDHMRSPSVSTMKAAKAAAKAASVSSGHAIAVVAVDSRDGFWHTQGAYYGRAWRGGAHHYGYGAPQRDLASLAIGAVVGTAAGYAVGSGRASKLLGGLAGGRYDASGLFKITPKVNVNGTSLVGGLRASRDKLVKAFGEPLSGHEDGKTNYEWRLTHVATRSPVTVYDYRARKQNEWSVGGMDPYGRDVLRDLKKALR